jgi:hypothetical protein
MTGEGSGKLIPLSVADGACHRAAPCADPLVRATFFHLAKLRFARGRRKKAASLNKKPSRKGASH